MWGGQVSLEVVTLNQSSIVTEIDRQQVID